MNIFIVWVNEKAKTYRIGIHEALFGIHLPPEYIKKLIGEAANIFTDGKNFLEMVKNLIDNGYEEK